MHMYCIAVVVMSLNLASALLPRDPVPGVDLVENFTADIER